MNADLLARHTASHRGSYRTLIPHTPGGVVESLDGVLALVTPSVPGRSLWNCVFADTPAAIPPALDRLASLYAEAGVRAWTVWCEPEAEDVKRVLAGAGHVFDGRPMRMGASLAALDLAPHGDVTVDPGTWAEVSDINERAYGVAPGDFPLGGAADAGWSSFVARRTGEALACVATYHHEGDCFVAFVATLPSAQRQGLASTLMRTALRHGAQAGCTTTTLEASAAGEPGYAKLGYQPLGGLEMWERRAPD